MSEQARKKKVEESAKQSVYSQVQRPNTGGKYSKTKQIEQVDNNTEKGSGSNRSSRMIKQIQAANNQADN